ncbi:hypothetical protein M758_8G093900 [Ceratodon purpureus]|nr:hypothetical protein M758_8G093900 [Ceratodon purpureus]
MSSKVNYTINTVNEEESWGTARSTKAHYRRVKKFCSSASPPVQNYERCGYNAGYTVDADGMYSCGFIGAPENGTFGDFYDVCNMCMAEDQSEEFVVQFLREKPDTYVNMAVTFVKGLSEKYDGSVVFDGGKYTRDYADGPRFKCTVEDERFEIGMKIDFTWGPYDYIRLEPKVVKCKGLTFDMPGFQMEIVGNYDASKNQHWDDKSRDFFNQTFNFRLVEGSEECYIRFARNHEEADKLGDHTIVTRDFQPRLDSVDGSNGINLGFTVRHRIRPEPQESTEVAPEHESIYKSLTKSPVEENSSTEEDCDPFEQQPDQERQIRFFDHPEHKLVLATENYYKDNYSVYCDACSEYLHDAKWVYRCPNNGNGCDYAIHAACAKCPRTLQHPSHSEHIVKLRKLSSGNYKVCDVCKKGIACGLHYHCAKCDFDAHTGCRKAEDCDPPEQSPLEGEGRQLDPEEEGEEWDPDQHMGMSPEQYLAWQIQRNQQMAQLQAIQLNNARQTAAMTVNFGRSMANF